MEQVNIIGLDLAKRTFQLRGAPAATAAWLSGRSFRARRFSLSWRGSRAASSPWRLCLSAHHWGRAIRDIGHEIRLIPPRYVKPFIKRQKNDAADAEAIAEAASRPTMRFVAVKTEEQQARAMLFRTRDLLVRQRTQLINALRGHLSEHGVVAPQGATNITVLAQAIENLERSMPILIIELARIYIDQIEKLSEKIAELVKAIAGEAARGAMTRRLLTMPGVRGGSASRAELRGRLTPWNRNSDRDAGEQPAQPLLFDPHQQILGVDVLARRDKNLGNFSIARGVWADTAYRSAANEQFLEKNGFRSFVHRKKPKAGR